MSQKFKSSFKTPSEILPMTISMRHFRAISAGASFALFCMPHISEVGSSNANCHQTTVFGLLNMHHSMHNRENTSEVPCSMQGWLIVLLFIYFFPNCIFRILFPYFQWAASQSGV